MKTLPKYIFAASFGMGLFSSCTMGDKGSEQTPDSVKIDTNIKAQQPEPNDNDTTLIDSLQTDTNGRKPQN